MEQSQTRFCNGVHWSRVCHGITLDIHCNAQSSINIAVIERRLCPRCCHVGSYSKHPKSSPVCPLTYNWYYCAQFIVKPKAAKCQQCLVTNKQSVRLSINSHQRFLFTGRFLLTSRLSLLSSGILITLQQRQPECATTFKMQ